MPRSSQFFSHLHSDFYSYCLLNMSDHSLLEMFLVVSDETTRMHGSELQRINSAVFLRWGLTNVPKKLLPVYYIQRPILQYCKIPLHFCRNWHIKYVFRLLVVLSNQIMESETRQACNIFLYASLGLKFKEHEGLKSISLV